MWLNVTLRASGKQSNVSQDTGKMGTSAGMFC